MGTTNPKHLLSKIIDLNDHNSYSEFFDYYYPRLFRFSLNYVKLPTAAEEVVSDVLYNLLKSRKKYENLNAYLYHAVKNRSLSWLRDQKKMQRHQGIEESEDFLLYEVDDNLIFTDGSDLKIQFENALKQLPKQRQLVFRLIREDGLSPFEVADLLDISVRTIEKHMQLSIKDLCIMLKEYIKDQRHHSKVRKIFPRNFIFSFF